MKPPISLVTSGVNVAPLLWSLYQQPELWDQETARTEDPASPHHGLSDIYIRHGEKPRDFAPHDSIWYPASNKLPVKELIFPLMTAMCAERLGTVLITKIPPGMTCKPHKDGGWHAGYYDKFGIQITSHPDQAFCFDNAQLVTRPGDVFTFDNSQTHWVMNPTPYERITLIVALKRGI
jgi:hypothetical protein